MRKIGRASSILFLGILIGCGGGAPDTSNPGEAPPHGGVVMNLPGGSGLIEIVKKDVPPSQANVTAEVAFYFFKKAYTPFSPNPSSGTLTVGDKKVDLKADGEALVTPPGPPLFKGGVDGTLTVELEGTSKSIPLGVR
jgi:hypothetical protein